MKPSSFRLGAGVTVLLMTAATLLSKLLGMLRSLLLASAFGTGTEASAFSAATRIPTALFDILLSAALTAGMIPILGRFGQKDSEKKDAFIASFLTLSVCIGGILTLLGILLAPALITLTAPGLSSEGQALAVTLLRLIFPSFLFCTAAYSLIALLQSRGKHLLPALVSALSNGALILYLLLSASLDARVRITGLAITYTAGWLLQALTLVLPLYADGWRYRPRLRMRDDGMKQAIRLSLPATLCAWLIPLTLLVGGARASLLQEGGSAIFDYASGLWLLLAGICTHSLTGYLFPRLAACTDSDFTRVARSGLTAVLALTMPITVAVAIFAERGVCLLYLRGAFTPSDAALTASLLRFAALSIPAFAASEWLNRICLAANLLRPQCVAAIAGMSAMAAVSLLSPTLPCLGLAVAVGQLTFLLTLCVMLYRHIPDLFQSGLAASLLKISGCTAAFACVCGLLAATPFPPATESGAIENLCAIALAVLPAALVYFILCRFLRLKISLP